MVLRYQLENKSIRLTLINFFSKCIHRENHWPFDLSLSLSLYIYIYTLKKLVNQPSESPNFNARLMKFILCKYFFTRLTSACAVQLKGEFPAQVSINTSILFSLPLLSSGEPTVGLYLKFAWLVMSNKIQHPSI